MSDIKCKLEQVGKSGRMYQITHENGRIIAQFIVHGPFQTVLDNCVSKEPMARGKANIFRGELFGLSSWEFIDTEKGCVYEK